MFQIITSCLQVFGLVVNERCSGQSDVIFVGANVLTGDSSTLDG